MRLFSAQSGELGVIAAAYIAGAYHRRVSKSPTVEELSSSKPSVIRIPTPSQVSLCAVCSVMQMTAHVGASVQKPASPLCDEYRYSGGPCSQEVGTHLGMGMKKEPLSSCGLMLRFE